MLELIRRLGQLPGLVENKPAALSSRTGITDIVGTGHPPAPAKASMCEVRRRVLRRLGRLHARVARWQA